jgi:hypothetical protein
MRVGPDTSCLISALLLGDQPHIRLFFPQKPLRTLRPSVGYRYGVIPPFFPRNLLSLAFLVGVVENYTHNDQAGNKPLVIGLPVLHVKFPSFGNVT